MIDPKIGRAATIAANKALGASPVKQAADLDGLAEIWARIVIPIALHFNREIMSKFFDVGGQYAWGPAYSSGNICSTSCFVSFDGTPNLSGGLLVGYIHTHPRNVGFSGGDLYTAYSAYTQLQSLAPIHAYVALPNNQVQEWSADSYLHQPYNDLWQEYSVYSRVVK